MVSDEAYRVIGLSKDTGAKEKSPEKGGSGEEQLRLI